MRRWSLLLGVALAGCGAFNPAPVAPFTLEEVSASPQAVDAGAPVSHDLGAAISRVAAGPDYVVAQTASGPVRVTDLDPPSAMPYVDGSGEAPIAALSALVSRVPPSPPAGAPPPPASGVLAVGPQGLLVDFAGDFEAAGLPLDAPAQASALDDLGQGDAEVVWVGVPGGLVQIAKSASTRYALSTETGAPSAVLQVDATLAWAAFGGKLYDLDLRTGQAIALPHDFGQIHALARGSGDGVAYVAASTGLYARDAKNHFKHYLANQDVSGLAFDAINGLYFTVEGGLMLLQPSGALLDEGPLPPGAHPLAIDGFGDVWAGADNALLQFHVGKPVGYLNDVKPFFAANCYACHVQQGPGTPPGTPHLSLDDYNGTRALADEIVHRVQGQGGVMPPAPPTGNGPLAPSEYGVVIRWYRSGELP